MESQRKLFSGGGLLADMLLVDVSGSGVYQVTPKGYTMDRHAGHSFPFRISDNLETIVTVANPDEDKDTFFSLFLAYDGQSYTYDGGMRLRPGEVRHINIKELRNNQVEGLNGKRLPPALTSGQVKVVFHDPRALFVKSTSHTTSGHGGNGTIGIAGAVIYDTVGKISFTSCWPTPPPEPDCLILDLNNDDFPSLYFNCNNPPVENYEVSDLQWQATYEIGVYAAYDDNLDLVDLEQILFWYQEEMFVDYDSGVLRREEWPGLWVIALGAGETTLSVAIGEFSAGMQIQVPPPPWIRISGAMNCSAPNNEVTRGDQLTLELVDGPANPAANNITWTFTEANNPNNTVTAQTTGSTWGGTWVASGSVTAQYTDASGPHSTPVVCAVTVKPRTGAGWAATPDPTTISKEQNYNFPNLTWLTSWNAVVDPVIGAATEAYGTITTPGTTAIQLLTGPNNGYSYFTAASLSFSNYRWVWAWHPDIENSTSQFAKCQTGSQTPLGQIISLTDLRSGIERHESSDVADSHLVDFKTTNATSLNLMKRMESRVEKTILSNFNNTTTQAINSFVNDLHVQSKPPNVNDPLSSRFDNSTNPPTPKGFLHTPDAMGVYPYACSP
jgi:hypothetical protein